MESIIKKVKINAVKENTANPRTINKQKFNKLVASVKEFPEMLKLRPIVVDSDMVILGGNMRYKACKEIGLKEVYIIEASSLTDEQAKEFIIKDNVGFGDWDWDLLANSWDTKQLKEWGMDVWQPEEEVDYSLLDEIDLDDQIQTMYDQTKKSIILEFPTELYENEVKELYDTIKAKGVDMSNLYLEALKGYEL